MSCDRKRQAVRHARLFFLQWVGDGHVSPEEGLELVEMIDRIADIDGYPEPVPPPEEPESGQGA